MSTAIADVVAVDPAIIEQVILGGDLSRLPPAQKVNYYNAVCQSVGLNPLTVPFAYVKLQGKEILYARKEATEQLRKLHNVSIGELTAVVLEGVYVVTATATLLNGRRDVATGAVAIDGLKGEARANAVMKAETKAKRRVTLSICGLGMLDESEIDPEPIVEIAPPQRRSEKEAARLSVPSAASHTAPGTSSAAPEPPLPPADDPFLTSELPEPGATRRARAASPSVARAAPPNAPGSDRSVEDLIIVGTSYATPKDAEPYYEITARVDAKGAAPIGYVFLTRDKGLYELAESCEGTGALFAATWHTAPRPDSTVAKVLDTLVGQK